MTHLTGTIPFMKKLMIITGVLLSSLFARSQPLADLVADVQAHKTSMIQLKALFSKHPSYIDETDYTTRHSNEACFGQRIEKADFHYTLADSIIRRMFVQVIYKNDQVHYIKIEGMQPDSMQKQETWQVVYRYIDTAYTHQVLKAYNQKHQTDFTWKDLYEDDLDEFVVLPGFMAPNILKDSNGAEIGLAPAEPFLSRYIMDFLPLIKKRDHHAMVKMCQSPNPARKAYGALCLYTLQQLKEPLTSGERQLIETISHSNEVTKYSPGGCYSSHPKKLSTFLTKMDLKHYATVIIEQAFSNNH